MKKKKDLVDHSATLTKEQFEIAKTYVDTLNSFREEPIENLIYTIGDYNLVQLIGHGDPIKAAERHRDFLKEMYAGIIESLGKTSKMVH
ncbi:hypothetical protein C8N46_11363 [Kordia periserrulae]|uniref:Uncharacterized protein n=1 Tax=Kordia periserrulae TaxID=701523 RepID=A0A2T6BR94_9FLAO|nr:hypothetical protein [Kordia periserrulae]PTX58572.1 hypothetical protein C8N46_11363 [Kordia periserrulae]